MVNYKSQAGNCGSLYRIMIKDKSLYEMYIFSSNISNIQLVRSKKNDSALNLAGQCLRLGVREVIMSVTR